MISKGEQPITGDYDLGTINGSYMILLDFLAVGVVVGAIALNFAALMCSHISWSAACPPQQAEKVGVHHDIFHPAK